MLTVTIEEKIKKLRKKNDITQEKLADYLHISYQAVSKWENNILKTECIYRVKFKTYEEARLLIGEYIRFYNNDRIQTKTKLTPFEKRNQFVA